MLTISANELKKKGVSVLSGIDEALLTVHGKAKYVVLDIELYDSLRAAELEVAFAQSKRDLAQGKYIAESVAAHIKRVTKKNAL
jgi:hypothetical protein